MNIFNNKSELYWRNFLTRLTLIVTTVIIIVWFLPRKNGPEFQYEIGKPWMYSSLIAKYDFPVYKSEKTIKAEKDSMLAQYEPYFNLDRSVENKEISKFINDYKGGINGLPKSFIYTIADRLHRLYQQGIIETPLYSDIYKDSTRMIRIVSGKQAINIQINCLYSTLSAYEQLFLDDAISKQRQILQKCNLNEYIEPNLMFDKKRSKASMDDLTNGIPLANGVVLSGQKIIDRGEIVEESTYRVLESLKKENDKRTNSQADYWQTMGGQILYVLTIMIMFTLYLGLFRKDYFEKPRSIMMLYSLILIFPIMVSLMVSHNYFSVYILPFAMVPIFVRVFMDSRTAFIAHVTMILICACALRYQYEFIVVQLIAGLVAIYSLRELSRRAQLFKTALLVTIASAAIYFSLELINDNDLAKIDRSMYTHLAINGVALLFAYPLMDLIERTFGFISNVTLIELSDTSKDLLRRLSEVAPGTFQHSISVSNLAAEIANKIGAKAQLVRTGALYHDIGKMTNPVFFTENQAGISPLDNMSCTEGAQMVISHVTEGLRLAEKYNLPNIIKDFITTHHGLGVAKYFYIKYKNEHPGEEIDDSLFTYPGPNPFTREQAILMMTDTVEAASRSLQEYTEASIYNMVNKLIDQQVNDGFFKDCPITFRDISVAKTVLVDKLKTVYHTRISYPELKK
ncbi:HD family phosphohydrolase [Xylanibacter oryzae]|uniref:HD family phosphohydrolase n=1 Tax=Xylanibacter oryzae TaxID=185293 RepID=UPI000563F5A0|nr:HDIG domain-containing metalloprotein [Xylanibacter oryzae]